VTDVRVLVAVAFLRGKILMLGILFSCCFINKIICDLWLFNNHRRVKSSKLLFLVEGGGRWGVDVA
jgi:hypothetical protein